MYLYWIHYEHHSNPKTQGYIGISNNPDRRLKEHRMYSENNFVKGALTKGAIMTILYSDLGEDQAKSLEESYRPEDCIGWNITKGGGVPPNSWKTSDKEQHAKNLRDSLKRNGTHNMLKKNRKGPMGNEFNSDSSRRTQNKMIEEGRHALKGRVNAVTLDGNIVNVSREEYYARKGELVATSSKIGKERMYGKG